MHNNKNLHLTLGIATLVIMVCAAFFSFVITFSLGNTKAEQFAAAFALIVPIALANCLAAVILKQSALATSSAIISTVFAAILLNEFLGASGWSMYESTTVLTAFIFGSVLSAPVIGLSVAFITQNNLSFKWLYVYGLLLLLFLAFFVIPNNVSYHESRKAADDQAAAKHALYEQEQAIIENRVAAENAPINDLKALSDRVVKDIYFATKGKKPIPANYTLPQGYEFVEYSVNKYELKFCIKPSNQQLYVTRLMQPHVDENDPRQSGRPLVTRAVVDKDVCEYAKESEGFIWLPAYE